MSIRRGQVWLWAAISSALMVGNLSAQLAPMVLAGAKLAQGGGASGTFSGTIPAMFTITDVSNNSLSSALGTFGTLTVGKGVLASPTALQFRLRSNAPYALTAQVTSLTGMTDGPGGVAGSTVQAIQTGDIGIGFTEAIDKSGASVVGGGATPTRTDTITSGYDVRSGWPSVTNGDTPSFGATLHSIYGSAVTILQGDRISARGDNSSSDNFLVVTVGVAILPQYLTATTFSGTVTFTVAATS